MQKGTTIGRFEVEQTLGQGGMATVYQVRHTQLDTVHALKLLKISHPGMARRLLQEGRIQARLKHPNVVAVVDVVEHEGSIGLLMEYVDGFSLEDCLAQGPMDLEDALEIFRQVLSGVAAAHAAGVTHRDLKPANILLTTQRERVVAKVTDFGIAKVVSEDQGTMSTRAGMAMGTPGYMAPEQITDSAGVDHRADVFALGAILYEMISGEGAFRGPDQLVTMNRTIAGTYLPLAERLPGTPQRISSAVDHALATDREERLPSCRALALEIFGDDSFLVPADASDLLASPASQRPVEPTAPTLAPSTLDPSLLGQPTLAPPTRTSSGADGFGSAPSFGDSLVLHPGGADADDPPTEDTHLAGPQSVVKERWGLHGDALQRVESDIRSDLDSLSDEPATGSARQVNTPTDRWTPPEDTHDDQPDDQPDDPPDERVTRLDGDAAIGADDASDMMGEFFWSIVRATLWGVVKTVQYGGVPIAMFAAFGWFTGSTAARELEDLSLRRQAQAVSLNRATERSLSRVPELEAAGANPRLLKSLQDNFERAESPAAKAAAAHELTGVMTQQLGQLPAPSGDQEIAARRALELALVQLDRESVRYADIDREEDELYESFGVRLGIALRIIAAPELD